MEIKQKIYLFSGLVLVILILLTGVVIKPLISETKTTSVLAEERHGKLLALQKTDQEYLKQLERNYNKITEDISLIKSGFLEVDKAVDFFVDLEDMASISSNDLKIEARDFPSFDIYLLGDFPAFMRFLGLLENSKYFFDVESIQIKRFDGKDIPTDQIGKISVGDIKTVLKIKNYTKDLKIQ